GERILHVVVVEISIGGRWLSAFLGVLPIGALPIGALGRRLEGGGAWRRRGRGGHLREPAGGRRTRLAPGARSWRRRHALGVGPGIGGFQVDDVAQKNFALVELVAPDDDGLEGERALA